MPPRLNLFTARNAVSILRQQPYSSSSSFAASSQKYGASSVRCQHAISSGLGMRASLSSAHLQRRMNSSISGGKGKAELPKESAQPKGPNQDQSPHLREHTKKCDGSAPGSVELEHGTPVDEILRRDKDALKYAPKVLQDQWSAAKGARSYSTSATLRQQELQTTKETTETQQDPSVSAVANMISRATEEAVERETGLKFQMPPLPLPKTEHVKHRYDPLVDQFTKLLMKDGKLSMAQKNMAFILDQLRTAPPPQINPKRRLLTSLPAPQLPLNPVLYLTTIVDSVAPLIKIRQQKGIAGGGAAIQVPVPLAMRQRRRHAIRWIIDASDRRRDSKFAQRVANELLAVAEGRSSVWDKREQVHKIGIAGRSNLKLVAPGRLASRSRSRTLRSIEDKFAAVAPSSAAASSQSIELVDLDLDSVPPADQPCGLPSSRFPAAGGGSRGRGGTADRATAHRGTKRGIGGEEGGHRTWSDREKEEEKATWEESRDNRPEQGTSSGSGLRRRHILWAEALKRWPRRENKNEDQAKMKFSHSIQFNAVPDWSAHYIAYDNLKKLIYSLEKQVNRRDGHGAADAESAPLLEATVDTDAIFRRALDAELEKICSFYQVKELAIFGEVEDVVKEESEYTLSTDGVNMDPVSETVIKTRTLSFGSRARPGSILYSLGLRRGRRESVVSGSAGEDGEEDDDGDGDGDSDDESHTEDTHRRGSRSQHDQSEGNPSDLGDSRLWGNGSSRPVTHDEHFADPRFLDLYNAGIALKRRAISVYVSLCELKSYIQLNKTGFSKALKKYDKILDRSLRRPYMNATVSPAYPFTDSTMQRVDENISRIEQVYADVITKGNLSLARRELRLHLREHVVWERNTVWREMIGIERKAQAANMGVRRTLLGGDHDPLTAQRQGDEVKVKAKEITTPLGRFSVPEWLFSLSFLLLVAVVIIFGVLLSVPIMEKPEQQNCLAMLVFVSLLWATEVIPLFVTSLLVPFLVVVLQIMRSDDQPHTRLDPETATKVVFASMWTPVIMLLLGGFTIAAALSKYDIARRMATFVLSKAGTSPRVVLVTNMFVSMFLSMWISNVAAPVLCYSIIQPLLRNLPPESNFSKALVLGIALAANIGGAASPIASPQNIIALENMYPSISWGTWFFVALPVCIISILLIWALLLVSFQPGRGTTIVPIRPVKDRFSGVQWFVSIVTLVTIGLWCVSHQLEDTLGDMGVIAVIPMVLFFGTGILTKEDFNNFLWTIIILAAGGLCLGKAVTSSGLLHTIAKAITQEVASLSLYGVLIVFAGLILVIATFISHTVAALIILPLVQQVGLGMEHPHPNLLVMASALMCSVAMGLPTSGFPNMTAIMMEIPNTGQRYLRVSHFLTRGIPASLISFVVVVTVGYGLMRVAGL